MEAITKKEVLEMTARIVAGMYANPIMGMDIFDQYRQQQAITQTFQNVTAAFSSLGVPLAADDS